MFVIYKKIASPETSPVLGPASANASPTLAPKESPTNDASPKMELGLEPEPFSLYACCCSARNNTAKCDSKGNNDENVKQIESQQQQHQQQQQQQQQLLTKSKYEFGHATHYTYNSTTPRLLNAFETGTPE